MGKSFRKLSTPTGGSKHFKRVISGKLQGTWDMANRYFLIEVPVGIADAYTKFRDVHGIQLLIFSAFECSGYEVGWVDVDYPIDCEDYLIEREFQRLKRRCLAPTEHPFSCMQGYTNFYNIVHPSHLVGGRVPMHSRSISPVRDGCASPHHALHRAQGLQMHSDRCVNRWSVSPTCGSPPSSPSPFLAKRFTLLLSDATPALYPF